jgi:hypothetical protein
MLTLDPSAANGSYVDGTQRGALRVGIAMVLAQKSDTPDEGQNRWAEHE